MKIADSHPEILILGMFDLTRLNSARAVRINNLYTSLKALAPTLLVSGNRTPRRLAIARLLRYGRLRRIRAIYVEASTSTATEMDLLFLALARLMNIPTLIYIPDAYQYFPDLYPRRGLKVKLLDWGWRFSIAAYLRLADLLLFPTSGLADCFITTAKKSHLPPAGLPDREWYPLPWETPTVIYVGATSYHDGTDLLLSAMEQVVRRYPSSRCRVITHNAQAISEHSARRASWLTIEQGTFTELSDIMRSATLALIPRRANSYNDLALPIKLFDYMSFGRPLVVTACRDMAMFVNKLKAGVVVDDTVDGLAQGIIHLLENRDLATQLGQNGYRAIQADHSWSHRAEQLLKLIEEVEEARLRNSKESPI